MKYCCPRLTLKYELVPRLLDRLNHTVIPRVLHHLLENQIMDRLIELSTV